MLEIPESITIAKQLNDTVKGKTIRLVKANQSPHSFAWYYGDPGEYDSRLQGKTIQDSCAKGGMVEIEAEDSRILLGDGVSVRYIDNLKSVPDKHQLYIEFEDDTALYATIQMYGGLWVFPAGGYDNFYYQSACEKPSPLSEEFDFSYFLSLKEGIKDSMSAKAFLATQQRIPGLGNGILQDILYHARIHPKKKMGNMDEQDYQRMFDAVKQTVREMASLGGRDTERDLFGNYGGYQTILSKKTVYTMCPACGNEIHKGNFLGGTIYFCEHCQNM